MITTERLSSLQRLLNLLTGFEQHEQDIQDISQSILNACSSPAAMGEAYGSQARTLMEHDPEGALVVHKDQVGNEGRILLSRIHFDCSLAWTLNTDLYEWIDWQLSDTHLYVSGNHLNKGGNDKVTMMWSIPLATGNATRFFYND